MVRACRDVELEAALDLLHRRGHMTTGEPSDLVVAAEDDRIVAVGVAYAEGDIRVADVAIEADWTGLGLGRLLGRALATKLCRQAGQISQQAATSSPL